MRLATYNIEWFSNLFDKNRELIADGGWSARRDVTRAEQADAIAIVLHAMDADAIMVIEAPNQSRHRKTAIALEEYAAAYQLRTSRAVMGFLNDTEQEIALLYDPARLTVRHDPRGEETGKKGSPDAPRFDSTFRIDLDIDATEDLVRFSKPPLELAATLPDGRDLRMIGVHLKSKAPHAAKTPDEVMRYAITNRRKQLAQAIWLRARVEEHLNAGEPVIVLGDLNDGPGLDEYEHLFGRSSVEIVMGAAGTPLSLYDPHARRALQRRLGANPTTARFFLDTEGRYLQALLDYVMISSDLMELEPRWRIWHPFDDPDCWKTPELRAALLTASDHFPVSVDLTL